MKNTKAFTLIEILVVVLIIGILAAIALPQYQKSVMKSELHRGISLVESIYQSQQSYYLSNGNFSTNFEDLDVSIPKNVSCTKSENPVNYVSYTCDFGTIGIYDKFSNIQFIPTNGQIAYLHLLQDSSSGSVYLKKDKRYCFAKPNNTTADSVCQNIGGNFIGQSSYWRTYILD